MSRLVQFRLQNHRRGVGIVRDDRLFPVNGVDSTYELARQALRSGRSLMAEAEARHGAEPRPYQALLDGRRILPPLDHPDPYRCWVTGTGLTHTGSAHARDAMHKVPAAEQTDSMKMFAWGLDNGRPAPGQVGAQPEWFYKGNGTCIVPPEAPLPSPAFALLDGDEIELCALYLIADDGTPCRLGFALGNEFSDHQTERLNYLYLAHSKLRPCSFGPELRPGPLPDDVRGTSRIVRDKRILWQATFRSGESHMCHSLRNLEHHLFKYALFRRPGDVHIHFLGTATVSFSEGVSPEPGDRFEMEAEGFGKPLRNILYRLPSESVTVRTL